LIQQRLLLLPGLVLGSAILLTCFVASLAYGAADIPLNTVWETITSFDGSTEQLIITTVRVPRSLIAIMVGSATAVAGAIVQGITRNPLADPGILGLESGASLAMVAAIFLFGNSFNSYIGFAFLGAGVTAILVYLIASLGRGGLTPLNLTVAGAAIAAFMSSITTSILILSQKTLDEIRFWLAGSIAGRDFSLFLQVLPYTLVGLAIAFILGRQITMLNLGEDVAKGLGQRTAWVKASAAASVILLAGSSVAIAGTIGFIGLVIPHIVRFFVGVDYRWILPYSAIAGAILLLVADLVARLLIAPQEIPVGVMTAIVGAPFFIYLARLKVKR
jgi:iron complex transport system permease protein